MDQMVVREGSGRKLGFEDKDDKWGIILPQVVAMGTVTRSAIEKTWLTASNVKKNCSSFKPTPGCRYRKLKNSPKIYTLPQRAATPTDPT
jgi:hypothetical protein